MDPALVKALRETKKLLDEGILSAEEFAAKKAELLKPKAILQARPAPKEPVEKPAKKAKSTAAALDLRSTPEHVIVTGLGTYKAKALLNNAGGAWSKQLQAWLFPKGTADKVANALKASTAPVVELTVHDEGEYDRKAELAQEKEKALAAARGTDAAATVEVKPYKKAVFVGGETKKVTATMKALGGSWNRSLSGWIFPRKSCSELIAELRRDPSNTVTVDVELADLDKQGTSSSSQEAATEGAKTTKSEPKAEPADEAPAHAEPKPAASTGDAPKSKKRPPSDAASVKIEEPAAAKKRPSSSTDGPDDMNAEPTSAKKRPKSSGSTAGKWKTED